MKSTTRSVKKQKHIALVAHDHCKSELLRWVKENKDMLAQHILYATGTTGNIISKETGLVITSLMSGPMGGDQQLGSLICEKKIDMLVFFWDPLSAVPHDPDVKALLRIAAVWNIPVAINRASARFMISSPMMSEEVDTEIPDYDAYLAERLH
ncbi:methylglyoxal synthase [Enterovibrio norvegicus]|uniref:Methylglyoxal synthase n=2 Tax=Enterovibrio norvegicus TaxID=188144 RepID=A0A1I5M512_9GAMM|nr:methylglyoxal synthase [Enterovibrio norvegicus]MCC4796692.1 methylglyoxal synthase [Enterovibrio norvegicus]OEE49553.1 methylglyoxal synthase [Enterovibrio norvegicus]OEF50209.1 methylglyoxal synthase [Enterovibrio norvegicus]OEF55505.1 methylglyoxal synthase [Enterovibrio norvegicus]PMH71926.1 methylglyoxal synthase [Enterovibrio norvegicus]